MTTDKGSAPLVGVGVVVRDPRGHILLGERVKSGETPSWCLPGGQLEAGEDFEEAALRELEEETGIRASSAAAFCLCVHESAAAPWLTAGVVVDVPDGVTLVVTEPQNFASWAWFPPDALPSPLFPATASLMDAIRTATPDAARAVYRLSSLAAAGAGLPSPTV